MRAKALYQPWKSQGSFTRLHYSLLFLTIFLLHCLYQCLQAFSPTHLLSLQVSCTLYPYHNWLYLLLVILPHFSHLLCSHTITSSTIHILYKHPYNHQNQIIHWASSSHHTKSIFYFSHCHLEKLTCFDNKTAVGERKYYLHLCWEPNPFKLIQIWLFYLLNHSFLHTHGVVNIQAVPRHHMIIKHVVRLLSDIRLWLCFQLHFLLIKYTIHHGWRPNSHLLLPYFASYWKVKIVPNFPPKKVQDWIIWTFHKPNIFPNCSPFGRSFCWVMSHLFWSTSFPNVTIGLYQTSTFLT